MPRVFGKCGSKSQKPILVFPPRSRCVVGVFILSRSRIKYIDRVCQHQVVLCLIQTCFHCTRSSTCGTLCCWAIPPSPSALAWPYCSSWGTDSWPTASTNASCCSQTCQVRRWTRRLQLRALRRLSSRPLSGRRPGRKKEPHVLYEQDLNPVFVHQLATFFSRQAEGLWPARGILSHSVWVDGSHPSSTVCSHPVITAPTD